MRKNNFFIGGILILAVVSLLTIWYSSSKQEQPSKHFRLVSAAATNAYSAPFYIAQEQKFWEAEGLIVEDKYFTSGRLALDALLAGGADIITVAETPMVFAGFSDQNAVIVATISSATNDLKVLARRDRGIEKPEDLKGKRIGMLLGATSEFYASSFLKSYGIGFNDVERINLNPADMPSALINGDIDAYVIWEPFVYNGYKALGAERAIRLVKADIYTLPFNLAVRKDFAAKHPDVVKAAIRALIRANDYIRANPDKAIDSVAKRISLAPDILRGIWLDYDFQVRLEPSLMDSLKREANWAKEVGLVKQDAVIPDYTRFVKPEFLREISAERVTLP